MKDTIVIVTGIPGAGKSTFIDALSNGFNSNGRDVRVAEEYPYLISWSELDESVPWLNPIPENFDIKPEGYEHMNVYVGKKLGEEINDKFLDGADVVIFETARGVGDPQVGYAEFIKLIVSLLSDGLDDFQVVHLEVVADIELVRQRMKLRFDEDAEFAPPPEILDKYLNEEGKPKCSAIKDIEENGFDLPIIMSEIISNNHLSKEGFVQSVEQLVPSIVERIEGGRGVERVVRRSCERR